MAAATAAARSTTGPRLPSDEKAQLLSLIGDLHRERTALQDEVTVRQQMAVSLANTLHQCKNELAGVNRNAAQLSAGAVSAEEERSTLQDQLVAVSQRGAVAERRAKEQEEQVAALKEQASELQRQLDVAMKFEGDAKAAEAARQTLQDKMTLWETRMKQALHKNREIVLEHEKTNTEQAARIKQLEDALSEAVFKQKTSAAKADKHREYATAECQTDPSLLPVVEVKVPVAAADGAPVTAAGTAPVGFRSPSPLPPSAGGRAGGATGSERPGTPTQVHDGADPFSSPPEIKPERPKEPAKPMIVSVHYNEGEFSLEKKFLVKDGMRVGDLVAQVCENVNVHHRKALDCAQMCLKTLHAKARRHVLLSSHRELHSFAYFTKCAQGDPPQPIVLYLEAIPSNAVFASPTSRLSQARGASASQGRHVGSVPR